MTLDFAYTLYLLLQQTGEVSKTLIKRYVQKWFVLSTLTSRYIGSPETQMDRDLRSISSKGFIEFLKENEAALLSDNFWNIGLVQNLETSAVNSPFFNTFIAAQIFGGDRSLLSNSSRVADLIKAGDVHHIFPREYLKKNGFVDKSIYNQVANYTYLDTNINIAVGEKPPREYFRSALEQCRTSTYIVGTIADEQSLLENLRINCIPDTVLEMTANDFPAFLLERRKQMATKIKAFYWAL